MVLAAVAAESHVLTAAHFSGVRGPMLVIDLGVPRNVDPVVGTLRAVTLLDMDTLSASVAAERWATARRSPWRRS